MNIMVTKVHCSHRGKRYRGEDRKRVREKKEEKEMRETRNGV